MAFQQEYKLADYFSVIGLDDELISIEPHGEQDQIISKVEIIHVLDKSVKLSYNTQKEKWIDLDGSNQIFLKIIFGSPSQVLRPITDINFYRIKRAGGQANKMKIPIKLGLDLIPIFIYNDPESEKSFKKTKKTLPNEMFFYYGNFDLTAFLEDNYTLNQQNNTNLCIGVQRSEKALPINNIDIFQGQINIPVNKESTVQQSQDQQSQQNNIEYNLPPGWKHLQYKLGKYPPQNMDRLYYEYPNSLNQFCFPSGIQFTTQRSTPIYFGFILTDQGGCHIYGTALLFDEVLSDQLKTKLKQNFVFDVENIYTQKAICILSHYAQMDSFKEILKQIYRIHLSKSPIPIERYVVNVMEEIPVPDKGNIMVLHEIGNQSIPFFRTNDQYPPYATKSDIEYLFRALDAEQVIDIFLALLLEKKILLISDHKALLNHSAVALISFLFPLCWKHVLIPILPKNMTDVLDAPFPFLIGIENYVMSESQNDIPSEVYLVDLDQGSISLRDTKPKLPTKEYKILKQRLLKATEGIVRPDSLLDQVDFAFNTMFVDPEEENFEIDQYEIRDAFLEFMSGIMSGYTKYLIAPNDQTDVFMDSRDFFDFKKFKVAKDATKPQSLIYKLLDTTLFANFIETRSFGKCDQDDQIMYFDETKIQPLLIKQVKEKKQVKTLPPLEEGLDSKILYNYLTFPKFDKTLFYVPRPIQNFNEDNNQSRKSLINNDQLLKMNDQEWARYLSEMIYLLWFQIFCTALPQYHQYSKELVQFAKKLLDYIQRKLKPMREVELIYRRLFESCGTCKLQEQILELFNDMKKNKIELDKITFGTYYQSFLLSKKIPQIGGGFELLNNKKSSYLQFSPEDLQKAFQSSKYEENKVSISKIQKNSLGSIIQNTESDYNVDILETQIIEQTVSNRASQVKLSQILENSLYLNLDLECSQCEKILKEEELLSGFSKNLSCYTARCPICKSNFVPKFTVFSEYKTDQVKGKEGISIQLLSPITLYKEYTNIVDQKSEQIILKEQFLRDHKTVFWNIVLYFKIMKLPLFIIDLDFESLHIKVNVSQIKKYLPFDKKLSIIGSGVNAINQVTKNKLDSDKLKRLTEQSPVRKSSIGRIASSVVDAITNVANRNSIVSNANSNTNQNADGAQGLKIIGGSLNNGIGQGSIQAESNDMDSNRGDSQQIKKAQSSGIANRIKKGFTGSLKSGSGGPQSVMTSLSDLERMEKIMVSAQFANKSIIKYFSKHLDEFRREMQYSKEIILSDIIIQQGIPQQMNKQASVNMVPNQLSKNFSDWQRTSNQQITAESIIKDAASQNINSNRQQRSSLSGNHSNSISSTTGNPFSVSNNQEGVGNNNDQQKKIQVSNNGQIPQFQYSSFLKNANNQHQNQSNMPNQSQISQQSQQLPPQPRRYQQQQIRQQQINSSSNSTQRNDTQKQ